MPNTPAFFDGLFHGLSNALCSSFPLVYFPFFRLFLPVLFIRSFRSPLIFYIFPLDILIWQLYYECTKRVNTLIF